MTDETSKYIAYSLHRLPTGIFGEAYVIVTGSEVNQGEYRAEHFILTQRPNEALRMDALDISFPSFPEELGSLDVEYVINEARRQAEMSLQLMLEDRAIELNRNDLAYLPFELEQRPNSLLSCWMRGLYTSELMAIKDNTNCPPLSRYLNLLSQTRVEVRGG